MISWFSFFSAQLMISAALLLVMILCRWKGFLERYSVSTLILTVVLAVVRMLLPLDVPSACVVEFWTGLSAIQAFFSAHPRVVRLLLGAWGAGSAAAVTWDVLSVRRAHRRYQHYIYVNSGRARRAAPEMPPGCELIVSPNVQVPFVRGAFRPIIYLPAVEMADWEIRLVVAHELGHVLGRDAYVKFLYGLLSAVFWWNPVIRFFRWEIDNLLEFRCDERVTRTLDMEGQEAYLQMLLNMSKRLKRREDACQDLSMEEFSALGRSSITKRRFHVIFGRLDSPPKRVSAVCIVCVFSLFFASYFVIFQFASYPEYGEFEYDPGINYNLDGLSKEVDSATDAVYIIHRADGRYQLYIDHGFVGNLTKDDLISEKYQSIPIYEEDVQT